MRLTQVRLNNIDGGCFFNQCLQSPVRVASINSCSETTLWLAVSFSQLEDFNCIDKWDFLYFDCHKSPSVRAQLAPKENKTCIQIRSGRRLIAFIPRGGHWPAWMTNCKPFDVFRPTTPSLPNRSAHDILCESSKEHPSISQMPDKGNLDCPCHCFYRPL